MKYWPQAGLEPSVGVKETVDVSPRRTKRHGQDGRSCRIRCVMSHVVGPVPQSQTCYTLSCHVPTVCARHVVTCAGGLHVRAAVSPPHHEHGGGGESWAQPSAPTVMLLLPKFHPPNTYTQPCTTHPHLKICVESLFHPPALLGSLRETAAFLKREGFSQRCPLVPPSHCSGDWKMRASSGFPLISTGPQEFSVHSGESPPSSLNSFSLFPGALQFHTHQRAVPASVGLSCVSLWVSCTYGTVLIRRPLLAFWALGVLPGCPPLCLRPLLPSDTSVSHMLFSCP